MNRRALFQSVLAIFIGSKVKPAPVAKVYPHVRPWPPIRNVLVFREDVGWYRLPGAPSDFWLKEFENFLVE